MIVGHSVLVRRSSLIGVFHRLDILLVFPLVFLNLGVVVLNGLIGSIGDIDRQSLQLLLPILQVSFIVSHGLVIDQRSIVGNVQVFYSAPQIGSFVLLRIIPFRQSPPRRWQQNPLILRQFRLRFSDSLRNRSIINIVVAIRRLTDLVAVEVPACYLLVRYRAIAGDIRSPLGMLYGVNLPLFIRLL